MKLVNEIEFALFNNLKKAGSQHGYLIVIAAWLFTISFIISNYLSYSSRPDFVAHKLESHLSTRENAFRSVVHDTVLLQKLSLSPIHEDSDAFAKAAKLPFGLFIYNFNDRGNPIVAFWNNNRMDVDSLDLKRPDGCYFVSYPNGSFELIKKQLHLKDGKNMLIAGLIPVQWNYFISNKYLKAHFDGFPYLSSRYEISTRGGLPVLNSNGKILFQIRPKSNNLPDSYDWLTIIFRTIACLFLCLFINCVCVEITRQNGIASGFSLLATCLILLRLISYKFPFPFEFYRLSLFDPSVYAANFIHPSLGDLLINVILLYWMTYFYYVFHSYRSTFIKWPSKILFRKEIFIYGSLVLLVCICFAVAHIIESLVLDSRISFDVTTFFHLDVFSAVSFLILSLLVLFFYFISNMLIRPALLHSEPLPRIVAIIAVTGLLIMSFSIEEHYSLVNLLILLWLILLVTIVFLRKKDYLLPHAGSYFLLFWVSFYAASVACLVTYESRVVELEQRKKMAEKLVLQSDPAGVNLLNIATSNFSESFLKVNFHRFLAPATNKFLKDSIIAQNFSGYLNKYDTRIYVYDSLFHPLYNDDSISYPVLKSVVITQSQPTSIPGLFVYQSEPSDPQSYIYQNAIARDSSSNLGYFYVVVRPKHYASEAIFPELFRQTSDPLSDLNSEYSYAVYNKGRLITQFNEYGFPFRISVKKNAPIFEERHHDNFSELRYNPGNDREVVIFRHFVWTVELMAMFSDLFCSFLIVTILFRLFGRLVDGPLKWKKIRFKQFNIRTQIHLSIIFLSIFSFIVIGIATISFFILRFNRNNRDRLLKSSQVIASEIRSNLYNQPLFDSMSLRDIGYNNDLEKGINKISENHNLDLNVYSLWGTLKVSTQPYIFNKYLQSRHMNPWAFYELSVKHRTSLVLQESIGGLSYLSIYRVISDDDGNIFAYLNIPYLNSQSELQEEVSGFLTTLINLNAFVFLIAGALSFLITSRITSSLTLIGNKMKKVSLGRNNEVIPWQGHDEIGTLIGEYNKMVVKLQKSAEALARSEREGAWREMARQVAHEIKNPLTPMKLSIQYLQKAIHDGAPNVRELSDHVADTLIEQIDQLSKIAGDFSQFANIGNIKLEIFDLGVMLDSLLLLYKTDKKIHIHYENPQTSFLVRYDKIQLNRLFTNLLKNAVESADCRDKILIDVCIKKEKQDVLVTISDNGKGIADDMLQKIFIPNFTTKSSGTGLGLAICRGITEKAGGRIWFETKENVGTTFYVLLPLYKA